MKFSNIMIVTDLDGTFYNSKTQLVQKNFDAVEYFKQNGGLFTYASGRVPNSFYKMSAHLKKLANIPTILCNGGYCYDFVTETRLDEVELDYERAISLINKARTEFPDTAIRCALRNKELWLEPTDRIKKVGDSYRIMGATETEICGFTRVSFEGEPSRMDEIRCLIESGNTSYFAFMKACPTIFEFQDLNATKGLALERLKKRLINEGIANERLKVYAMGDFENDIYLLLHSDVPACPENAIESVKKISKVQLCHCDDGCAADLISRIEAGEI